MKKYMALLLCGALSACASFEDTSAPAPVYNAAVERHDSTLGAHMVSGNESLQQIAANYGTSIDDILRANNLSGTQVAAGQRLYLPETPEFKNMSRNGTQTFIQRSGNGLTNSDGITVAEAQPLSPMPSSSLEPIQSESLAPLGGEQPHTLTTASAAPVQTPVTAAPAPPVSEPVKVASSLPPEQWSDPITSGFRWPVKGPTLSNYGEKADGLRNDGINIGALEGTAIEAAADGEIVYTGQAVDGFGNLVLMKHKNGFVTAYGHLSRVDVTKGQTIHGGQIIGGVGKTGSVNAPQLHFEIRKGSEILNPSQYLKGGSDMSAKTAGL